MVMVMSKEVMMMMMPTIPPLMMMVVVATTDANRQLRQFGARRFAAPHIIGN